jgi:hypothetical protein
VLIPIANLRYLYPGGPVEGRFTARYGPDSRWLGEFSLRVQSSAQVPAMLDEAVRRFDSMFSQALAEGKLRPDPTLALGAVQIPPEVRALIEAARRAEEARASAGEVVPTETGAQAQTGTPAPDAPQALGTFTVQVATPDGRAFDAALGSVRGTAGVRGVAVSSTAIGGTSVMRVTYLGDMDGLANALRAAGWQVTVGSNALGITR